jgi:hypothetical protein
MRRCLSEPPDVERAIVAAPSGRFSGALKAVLSFTPRGGIESTDDYSTAAPEMDT